ncbi:MAG: glutamine--fructose-6-phosphate transaminase (isomerizing) [Litorilinea sp.]
MCGIVGYIGEHAAAPIVLEGLRRLEYRGYDSAGIAVLAQDGHIQTQRRAGKLYNLAQALDTTPLAGSVAIGHTRWATHGPPCERNAHPHLSPDSRFAVVQNGIVENFVELRRTLQDKGYSFCSDTDTETIVHLVHHHYNNGCAGDFAKAVRMTIQELQGPSAIVVASQDHPDCVIAARLGNAGGVVIGLGEGETFIASDLPAILKHTRKVIFLENRQFAIITRAGVSFYDFMGNPIDKQPLEIQLDAQAAEKGKYTHFMQKEIFEQGNTLTDTLRGRLDVSNNRIHLDTLNLDPAQINAIEKISIVACGTSYYAGLVGKYLIERVARIPVEVDYASEFRYRSPIIRPNHLVLAISQSGETVDTLAALEEGREQGATTAAIVNAVGSQAERVCQGVVYMQAGPEIGVASTKAFTASVTSLYLLAAYLGKIRNVLTETQSAALIRSIATLPGLVGDFLDAAWHTQAYAQLAARYQSFNNFLYIGRGINYPVAREGALKLKEISYIHAEGYPAGEMKHGPIALIDAHMPTVVIVPRDSTYDKMVSQIEQVKARGGQVLAVAHHDDAYVHAVADAVMPIPAADELLNPVLAVLPLQLLAYEIALCRGTDIDQPRNLAKSVTVE